MAQPASKDKRRLDWRKPNVLLAEQLGVTREAVRLWRVKANAPAPLFVASGERGRLYAAVLDRLEEIRGLPTNAVQGVLGFPLDQSLKKFVRQHGQTVRSSIPWDRVNFDLPSSILAKIWRVQIQQVHTERTRNGRGDSKWIATRNHKLFANPEFCAAVRADEEKARRYYKRCKG